MNGNHHWDQQCDVIVVGSGAGGLTAALMAQDLGLDSLIIEKTALIGGTTAVSAGVIWIPDNPLLAALGATDSAEDARTYLRQTVGELYDADKIQAYLDSGPAMVDYLARHTEIRFRPAPLPDYYSNLPGGKESYRALDPEPLDARCLADNRELIRPPHPQIVVGGLMFNTGEVATILRREPGWLGLVFRQAAAQYSAIPWRLRHHSSPRLTLGNALIGRCLLSIWKRQIPLWRHTALLDLIRDEQGAVIGLTASKDGKILRLRARRGVILATGGFSANPQLRAQHLRRSPNVDRSVAPDFNCGDGILAGIRSGAATDLMEEAWWIPSYRINRAQLSSGMFMERAFPGSLMVDQSGKRFTNEAANYDHTGRSLANLSASQGADSPAFFIFDGRFRSRYMAGPLMGAPSLFDVFWSKEVKELIVKAPSIEALATRLGIDPSALQLSVDRFNQFAITGVDRDFNRGEERYDRHYSDPRVKPNSTMAPLLKPPFYALPVYAGDIGTKGGLATDRDARVLDAGGSAIPGLYAIGNTAASLMGRSYPGGGVTIGPSMVFGTRAALHIADKSIDDLKQE